MQAYIKRALVAAAIVASAPASAIVIQFNSLAGFNAVTTGNIVEQNTAPSGAYTPIGNSLVNGITYPSYAYMVDPAFDPARYDWGTGAVLLQASSSTLSFAPTTAFSALFGSYLPYGADMTVEIGGSVFQIGTAQHPTLSFFGWTSDTPFSSVTFYNTAGALAVLDNVTRAEATNMTEPGSLALMGLAILGLAAALGRRKKTAA